MGDLFGGAIGFREQSLVARMGQRMVLASIRFGIAVKGGVAVGTHVGGESLLQAAAVS